MARSLALAAAAVLPAACIAPRPAPPANPFAGVWSTAERQQIAFRDDTVVINPPDLPPTPLDAASCDGTFRFGYSRESRGALLGLPLHQPDVEHKLAALLPLPDYPVAELTCGNGGTVYVLLDEHDLLAIHHDRDVVGLEQLSRS